MLTDAVETYLAIRRAGGFKLQDDERYLNNFARFATASVNMMELVLNRSKTRR